MTSGSGHKLAPRTGATPVLGASGLRKRYGATVALADASFDLRGGEVHALIGENGAGKSTLVKILSGLVRPDSGRLEIAGRAVSFAGARAMLAAGIATAFQELSHAADLTVAENLMLGRDPRGLLGFVSVAQRQREALEILAEWEADDLDPLGLAGTLTLADQQRLEIVKALSLQRTVLVLDEPTSALGAGGVEWLTRQVARAKQAGAGVIFISHRMDEVVDLCDRITVLRTGRSVATLPAIGTDQAEIVQLMLGRAPEEEYLDAAALPQCRGEVLLRASGLRAEPDLVGADLELHAGEIVGVAGLQGQGQATLFRVLYGERRPSAGKIEVGGEERRIGSPREAIARPPGVALVPEDRKTEGLLMDVSVASNTSLASLRRFSRLGVVRRRGERRAVSDVLARLGVDSAKEDAPVSALSGGNQQKVVLAKCLLTDAKVMLLYDPTRGVDVGVKRDMFAWMREFAGEGGAILFYSSDIQELVHLCSRVQVYYQGAPRRELAGAEIEDATILTEMLGGKAA